MDTSAGGKSRREERRWKKERKTNKNQKAAATLNVLSRPRNVRVVVPSRWCCNQILKPVTLAVRKCWREDGAEEPVRVQGAQLIGVSHFPLFRHRLMMSTMMVVVTSRLPSENQTRRVSTSSSVSGSDDGN